MSNDLVNYDEMLAQYAKKATATEKPSSSSLTTKAGVLSYNGEAVKGNKLDVIVIASSHANLYYEDKYDPNNIKNPVCFAYSENPDEIELVPHPKSQKIQSETTCAECWANQWGSDPDGGRGKACKNSRKLAVIPAGVEPADVPSAEVAALTLPVTTVNKNWSPYVHKLATLYGRPPFAVKTQLGTQPDTKTQFKVTFDDVGMVDVSLIKPIMDKIPLALEMIQRVYEPNTEEAEGDKKPARAGKKEKF